MKMLKSKSSLKYCVNFILGLIKICYNLLYDWADTGDVSEIALWHTVWTKRDSIWQPGQVLNYIPEPSGLMTHKYANTNTYLLSFIIEAVKSTLSQR
jgi:hypothetical protein